MADDLPNLTSFASLVGESFTARIDQLQSVIGDAHYPSIGRYKERILAELISNVLPNRYEVATGFVLFPTANTDPKHPQFFDPLNRSAFCVSRQCDILVFDAHEYPVIFRDGDLVVVRPESVRAAIEIKGTLSSSSLKQVIEHSLDFGAKWRATQQFYRHHYQRTETDAPALYALAWRQKMRDGKPEVNASTVRSRIAAAYQENIPLEHTDAFPLLRSLCVYNEYEVSPISWLRGEGDEQEGCFGFRSERGRFIRVGEDGAPYWGGDRTIASIVAALHNRVSNAQFNRFISYTDEVKQHVLDYAHRGNTEAWSAKPDVRELIRIMAARLRT